MPWLPVAFGAWTAVKMLRDWLADDDPHPCWICGKRSGREEGLCRYCHAWVMGDGAGWFNAYIKGRGVSEDDLRQQRRAWQQRHRRGFVGAPPQGDLSSVGLEEGGIADQAGAGGPMDERAGNRSAPNGCVWCDSGGTAKDPGPLCQDCANDHALYHYDDALTVGDLAARGEDWDNRGCTDSTRACRWWLQTRRRRGDY